MKYHGSCLFWLGALLAFAVCLSVACKQQPGGAPLPILPAQRAATVPATSPASSSPPDQTPSQVPASGATKVPATPVEVAKQLFAALRASDGAALTALVRFPFQLRDTGSEGDCKGGIAENAEQVPELVRCLISDSLLTSDLREHPQLQTDEIAKKDLPLWTKKWRGQIQFGQTLVHVMVPGNGNTFHFIVLTSANGVHAVWKDTTFEGG